MKNFSRNFRGIVAIAAFLSVAIITADVAVFKDPTVPLLQIVQRMLPAGLLFALAAVLLIGRKASLYRRDYKALQSDPEKYASALGALGKAPLVSLVLFVLLNSAFLAALMTFSGWFGIPPKLGLPLFLQDFAFGMLNASLIYVLSDRLVTRTLLSHELALYPRALREARQQVKIFIIPTFMALMSMLFSFASALLVLDRVGGDMHRLDAQTMAIALGSTLVFVAIMLVLVLLWNMNTGLVYRSVIAQMEMLSSSEKDLTRRVSISSVDELGTIAGMINEFSSALADNLSDLKAAQGQLSRLGFDLRQSAGNSAAAVQQITSGVGRVREKAENQSSSVSGSSSAVQQVAKNIESLDRLILDQSSSVTEASASIEEMVGNIGSINGSIDKMAGQFSELAEAARDGTELQSNSSQRIANIAERSKALQEANTSIAAIASQTNLLAMNAAIEAAHAGEAGKGFSVVADEIRRLAETSAEETRKINSELAGVQAAIEEVVAASKSSEDAFIKVADRISDTERLVREVQAAIGEQREGAAQILEALRTMNDITAQVRNGSREMSEGNGIVLSEMSRLKDCALDIRQSMDEMASGAAEINSGAQKVSFSAVSTQETIAKMEAAIGCFRT